MQKQIKKAIICIGCIIASVFILGTVITYNEYNSEKSAAKIFKEQHLDTLSKKEARQWVNYNIGNSNATKWYLHQMINNGSAPDTISFWEESNYIK